MHSRTCLPRCFFIRDCLACKRKYMEIMISSLFVEENHGGPTRVIDSWELTAYITRDTELVFTLGEKCLRKENSAGILIFPFYLFIQNKRTQDLIAYGWMWLEQSQRIEPRQYCRQSIWSLLTAGSEERQVLLRLY